MATTDPNNGDAAEAFRTFPFTTDQEYQAGLQSILASDTFKNGTDAEKEVTLRLSRVFYFNKVTGSSLTPEDALGFETSARVASTGRLAEQGHEQAAREEVPTLTFAELKALIEQGKTDGIPNNKLIPNTLNDAPPSESAGQIRKKPWEM